MTETRSRRVPRWKLDLLRHTRSTPCPTKATGVVANINAIHTVVEHVLLGPRVPVLQVFARNVDDCARDTIGSDMDL